MEQFLLAESAAGYAIFKTSEFDDIGRADEEIQEAMSDAKQFSKIVKLVAFRKFETADEAVEEISAIALGEASEMLIQFLEANLPKKKKSYELGVIDPALGVSLKGHCNCVLNDTIKELLRGVRMHFSKLVKELTAVDAEKARLGLGHCYSRNKMQLDPNRQDKPIMNTIALLDNLDKFINTFAMRVKEWYAWHFPEMTKIVTDNIIYAKVCIFIRLRDSFLDDLTEEKTEKLGEIVESSEVAEEVIKAMKMSMGQDIVEMDMANIENFANQVIRLAEMRKCLTEYLNSKMNAVAPNLATLIGDFVGARLISHAGSLTNLAKYPASTVQILGAEKALFRALKTKSNTPKYGLIYHSPFIGRANAKNKGRISRYLANKASIAARIDCFAEVGQTTTLYGEKLKDQVEERLVFLTEGQKPRKNLDVMREAVEEVTKQLRKRNKKAKKAAKEAEAEEPAEGEPSKKKRKVEVVVEETEAAADEEENEEPAEKAEKKKKKKDKKEKKAKKEEEDA